MARRERGASPGLAAMSLMMNVPQVMALRLAKIGRGGRGAPAEFSRMFTEKMQAAVKAQAILAQSLLAGRPTKGASRVVRLYAGKVASNRQRLSRRG